MTTIKDRARAYIAKMPPAISGSGGDAATFKVACVLVKGFGFDEDHATLLFTEWNEANALPPWTEGELRQKLRSAARLPGNCGYLLGHASPVHHAGVAIETAYAQKRASQHPRWPAIAPLTASYIQAIARLRKLPVEAVDLCAKSGFMGRAVVGGHPCFVMGEQRIAQARRLDGQPFTLHDGTTIKVKNLPGSEGAFIGRKWLSSKEPILLVEGTFGLVEAVAAIILADRADWTCLAAASSTSRFARERALLEGLRGRRVRIVPDADEAGLDAAAVWLTELESAGAIVDALSTPQGHKDLGEVLAVHERHTEFLTSLFL